MNQKIELTERVIRSIREHVLFHYPKEACGILLGSETDRIEDIRFAENTIRSEEAECSYKMDPFLVYRIERELPEGQSIRGFYHSHPNKPAVPSTKDAEYMIPNITYLIISTDGNTCSDIMGYKKQQAEADCYEKVEVILS